MGNHWSVSALSLISVFWIGNGVVTGRPASWVLAGVAAALALVAFFVARRYEDGK